MCMYGVRKVCGVGVQARRYVLLQSGIEYFCVLCEHGWMEVCMLVFVTVVGVVSSISASACVCACT